MTRCLTSTLAIFVLFPVLVFAQAPAREFPPHTFPGTELRVLPPTEHGRHYQLHVALPESYAEETTRRYPVLFVTDGYWDFATITTSYNNLAWDKVVPEMIIVGLGYAGEGLDYGKLRQWELSPVQFGNDPEASGHAADFLATLEKTIIPLIEREYRADPDYRVLAGSSLGGAFTLHALYTRPELFKGYIAASPAVSLGDRWFFKYEAAFAKAGRPLEARLFLSAAEYEWPSFVADIEAFWDQVVQRKQEGLKLEFRLIESERHSGTKAEAYVRGMRFAFAPIAPETGPIADDWQH
jgi:predicted alpha/beta superfamily hydrolase